MRTTIKNIPEFAVKRDPYTFYVAAPISLFLVENKKPHQLHNEPTQESNLISLPLIKFNFPNILN